VPYNPLLLVLFKAHINVEVCNSIKSIKYVCKYINKGTDQLAFSLLDERDRNDEITKYLIGRYINANEAAWKIFQSPIHGHFPAVQRLQIHLQNEQIVYYNSQTAQDVSEIIQQTTLTAFFNLCLNDSFARTLLYAQVPTYYTWQPKQRLWQRRKQGVKIIEYQEEYGTISIYHNWKNLFN
jgi:hypothetical protein